ncbi:hypothetical protein [Litoribaculum gwangyangense]|uniref:hypothetical protein n=1 Tax=Litoribaculum gwangyangense TaxID=1130722 RepID=UPI0031E84735
MNKSKILVGCVLSLYVLFAFFEAIGQYTIAFHLDSLIIPLITLIYILFVKNKSRLFLLFLLFYSISDIFGIVTDNLLYYYVPYKEGFILYEYDYYIGTGLYIMAYIFLFIKIAYSLSLPYVFKNYKIHLVVLTILNIYLIYVLQLIVEPHLSYKHEFGFELIYNLIMLLVLSASLINFFYRDNKKSLYLFIGSLCIVFSEVLDIAYIYITQRSLINFLGTTLALGAFYFYFQQSKLLYESNGEKNYMIP